MARRLQQSAREMPGELAGPQRAQARARRHVAHMVVTIVIGKHQLIFHQIQYKLTHVHAHTHFTRFQLPYDLI